MTETKEKRILYEDEKIEASVPGRPACKGHIQVNCKEEKEDIQDMEEKDFQQLIYGASFAATALFENLQAHGTNIILNTGGELKKEKQRVKADVLARFSDDGMKLMWKPKRLPEAEMKEVQKKIKDKTGMIGIEKKKKEVVDMDKKRVERVPGKIEGKDETKKEKPRLKEEIKGKEEEEKSKKPEKNNITDDKEKEQEKKEKEKEESYLIKQLRRMP